MTPWCATLVTPWCATLVGSRSRNPRRREMSFAAARYPLRRAPKAADPHRSSRSGGSQRRLHCLLALFVGLRRGPKPQRLAVCEQESRSNQRHHADDLFVHHPPQSRLLGHPTGHWPCPSEYPGSPSNVQRCSVLMKSIPARASRFWRSAIITECNV